MPSSMIHIFAANEISHDSGGLFWLGNFAPDYPFDRDAKDIIHFRNAADRLGALEKLKKQIYFGNEFESGWLLHLFFDYLWDETQIESFKKYHRETEKNDDWFLPYREETGKISFYLFHNLPWSKKVWEQIMAVDINKIKTSLPINIEGLEYYRQFVFKSHSESDKTVQPGFFTIEILSDFTKTAAAKYKDWIGK